MRIRLDPPVEGAYVILENIATGKCYCCRTGVGGTCRLYVPMGTYWIHVFKSGFVPYSKYVDITQNVEIEIKLTPEVIPVPPPHHRTVLDIFTVKQTELVVVKP